MMNHILPKGSTTERLEIFRAIEPHSEKEFRSS